MTFPTLIWHFAHYILVTLKITLKWKLLNKASMFQADKFYFKMTQHEHRAGLSTFYVSIFSAFGLVFIQIEIISAWKVKNPPQVWNLLTVTSQHENYQYKLQTNNENTLYTVHTLHIKPNTYYYATSTKMCSVLRHHFFKLGRLIYEDYIKIKEK